MSIEIRIGTGRFPLRGWGAAFAVIAALATVSTADAYEPYGSRWGITASGNFGATLGRPAVLTWSIVPDGTTMPDYPDSNPVGSTLIQRMDQQFGAGVGGSDLTLRPWFSRFSQPYARMAAVSGLTFIHEPNDDGASFPYSSGLLGTRGDIRIGGKPISTSVIAYNYPPSWGEMVLSTSRLSMGGNSGLKDAGPFRSTFYHETLHGLGFGHVRQDAQNTLMGPSATSTYDLQFDDILGLQHVYGDVHEKSFGNQGNGIAARATTLGAGTLNVGGTVSIGTAAPDGSGWVTLNGTVTDFVSISGAADVDYFRFSLSAPAELSGILDPKGLNYQTGPDGGSLAWFNSKAQNDLTLTIYSTDGTTMLGMYNNAGLGGAESFQEVFLTAPGDYYARVTGSNATTQMYRLDVSAAAHPYFWDNDGSTNGFGTASGTWAAETVGNTSQGWVMNHEGTTVPGNVTTSSDVPVYFGTAARGLAAGTINVSGTVQSGNMTFGAASGHIRLEGGTINLPDVATIKADNAINTIQSFVTGAGTSLTKTGNGTIVLAGGGAGSGGGTLVLQAGTLRLGAHDAISTGRTLSIREDLNGHLDLNGFDQTLGGITSSVGNKDTVFAITGGATSTLTINATAAAEFGPGDSMAQAGAGNTAMAFTVDLSGIGGFVWNGANQTFRVGLRGGSNNPSGATSAGTFTTLLADTSSITAATIAIGDRTTNSNGGHALLRLGQTATLNANTIAMGTSGRSNATMNFRTGLTEIPTVTIRGMDGVAPVTLWDMGSVANFEARTWTAAVNFESGELDAKVTMLRIATINAGSSNNRTGTQNSSFTMGRGVLEAESIVIGNYSGSGGSATGSYTADGTFTLNHSEGLVRAGSVVLANNVGTSPGGTKSVIGRFNLNAGTLEALTISRGAGGNANTVTPQFNFAGGTVRNAPGQDLTISNVPIILTGAGTRVFEATANQTITVASNAVISGSGLGFTKAGDGTMIINSNSTYTGLTTVSAGTLLVNGTHAGAFTVASGATLGGTGTINGNMTLGGDSLFWITDLNSPMAMGGGATLSFTGDGGGFGIDRLLNIDWDNILAGTYTLVSGNVDFSNIRNVGLANAHVFDWGYSAYFQEGSLQLVVTPVPEPSAIVILAVGAGFLGVAKVRRRRAN
jgi:autotransporter-associated beta strand protein